MTKYIITGDAITGCMVIDHDAWKQVSPETEGHSWSTRRKARQELDRLRRADGVDVYVLHNRRQCAVVDCNERESSSIMLFDEAGHEYSVPACEEHGDGLYAAFELDGADLS